MSETIEMSTGFKIESTTLLVRQIKDFAQGSSNLLYQRQMIFLAALVLAGYYYDAKLAIITGLLIFFFEICDYFLCRRVLAWSGQGRAVALRYLVKLMCISTLSALVIAFYAIFIALIQGPGAHFMSLFFLFAAALFAAMNNHQILPVLVLRLTIYGATFVFIPAWDIYTTGATLQSELWAQLLTALFVLYFVIDCSRLHLISYRKNLNQIEELKGEHQKARDAVRIKSDFLSTMSHELRTPLTSIKGAIDLMKSGRMGDLPETANRMLSISQRNCGRLIKLIDEILDLQKIEAGRMRYDKQAINVSELVRQTIASIRPYADQLGVAVTFTPSSRVETVCGDRARLEQVLTNVLSNAAKFSSAGSTVHVEMERLTDHVRVRVIDEGVGLEKVDEDKVFDRFSQLDASVTRKIGGTGLGMNISRKIMEAQGGRIHYIKNKGPGTTFFIDMNANLVAPDVQAISSGLHCA